MHGQMDYPSSKTPLMRPALADTATSACSLTDDPRTDLSQPQAARHRPRVTAAPVKVRSMQVIDLSTLALLPPSSWAWHNWPLLLLEATTQPATTEPTVEEIRHSANFLDAAVVASATTD
ncbi:unnamed protein product [Fusarium graminearum]|nr:unnamed protein product [Fusarium graminearum]